MDIKALKLASLFSYSPNSRGYCGCDSAGPAFQDCIQNNNCDNVSHELSRFIALHPYLQTIGKIRNLSPFDYKVIEAYWIGNDLLEDFPREGYGVLLEEFVKQGVPKWLVTSLRAKIPKLFIPHHLFQVLHVGVGQASGSVPFNINSINSCMVRHGKIIDVTNKSLIISLAGLRLVKGKYLPKITSSSIPIHSALFCKPKVGDIVAIHWGQVVKILKAQELERLELWSENVLKAI